MRKSYEAMAKTKANKLGFAIDEDEFTVNLNLPEGYNGMAYHSTPYHREYFGTDAELWQTIYNDIDSENKYKVKCTPKNCDCWDDISNRCDYLHSTL